ncbi:MAG TPA: hypothetical protein VF337_04000 [Candidatus Limnocylindrales bacterium]
MTQLREESSDTTAAEAVSPIEETLEETLVDILDLSLQADQALWRLEYSGSEKIHRLLHDFVFQCRQWDRELSACILSPSSENLAKRAAAIPLELLPAGKLRDKDMVAFFGSRFARVGARVRHRMESADADEAVTRGLLTSIAVGLEKQSWMLHFEIDPRTRRSAPGSRTSVRQGPSAA